jgi:hypothetical protein
VTTYLLGDCWSFNKIVSHSPNFCIISLFIWKFIKVCWSCTSLVSCFIDKFETSLYNSSLLILLYYLFHKRATKKATNKNKWKMKYFNCPALLVRVNRKNNPHDRFSGDGLARLLDSNPYSRNRLSGACFFWDKSQKLWIDYLETGRTQHSKSLFHFINTKWSDTRWSPIKLFDSSCHKVTIRKYW